ncbi:MAG TPA: 8-oxo-dGTP diphosphatase MutT [Pseudomonadales bacterium]|nr:8-oxo-dGTP diphosphatase MutT [Pseudomonadales bacterium]
MTLVHVAVGVIVDDNFHILLSQRPDHVHQGGKWEFPGGKVENGESVPQALKRELHEELGIRVLSCFPLCQVKHDYGDKTVLLDTYLVDAFEGQPVGKEQQPVAWYAINQLGYVDFPAANIEICRVIAERFNNNE